MTVWAVANQKGGVGKTTSAVTLAGILTRRGERVLLVDLDPHGSMSSYFGLDPDETEASVYSLFERDGAATGGMPLAALLHPTGIGELHLLPASTALATLDRQLAGRDGMGLVVARSLSQCRRQFDHIFIDCPPVLGVLMVNALAACDSLLIPVQTEFLALKGLERMLRTLSMILQARHSPLPYIIVPTFFDRRTRASRESLQALRRDYPRQLWPGVVPVDTRFREASRMGKPLPQLDPGARGVVAYSRLLEHLLNAREVEPVQQASA